MAKNAVTFKGKPLTLVSALPRVGEKIPECELTNLDLNAEHLGNSIGKPLLILSVPSLDTSVCSTETLRFSKELVKLGFPLKAIVVSMDLPFAQKRWCLAEKVQNIQALSDFQKREFGNRFGVLTQELGLLARAVFLVDEKGILRYLHLVPEITQEPPYDEVLHETKKIFSAVK